MKYHYMDPAMIMTIVVSLIILGVGVFAFFVTVEQIYTEPAKDPGNAADYDWPNMTGREREQWNASQNTAGTGNQVFNIIGVVLIIGAIMTIVGLVYSYVKPGGY